MNFKKLALLSLFGLSTTLPTLPMHRLTRLTRPVLGRLNICRPAGLSAARQALPIPARTARLLAGAGAATATAALLSQQPAEAAAQIVTYRLITNRDGHTKCLMVIHNNDCDADAQIRAKIQDIVDQHNQQMGAVVTKLKGDTCPSYLLIEASPDDSKDILRRSHKPNWKPSLIEATITHTATGNKKLSPILFDSKNNKDLAFLEMMECNDQELLQEHGITAKQRDKVIARELPRHARANKKSAKNIVNATSLPPEFKKVLNYEISQAFTGLPLSISKDLTESIVCIV